MGASGTPKKDPIFELLQKNSENYCSLNDIFDLISKQLKEDQALFSELVANVESLTTNNNNNSFDYCEDCKKMYGFLLSDKKRFEQYIALIQRTYEIMLIKNAWK